MIAIFPKFLETLKHSEDDSGRVDNVMKDDGKERVRDNIVSGKDNAVYRFPPPRSPSSASATLPMPPLALGTSAEGAAQESPDSCQHHALNLPLQRSGPPG